jgi:N-acetylneuraminate synthase/pseudaminic acid synthase
LGKVDYTVDIGNRGGGRSLYIAKDMKKGDSFTPENLRSIRPANGLHPKYYEDILGKRANCNLSFGTPMKLEYIEK